jgi:uncharacterized protein (TIRG00374 family)
MKLNNILRPIIGMILILLIIYFLDINKTSKILKSINFNYFIYANIIVFVACIIASYRLKLILQFNKVSTSIFFQVKIYFEGLTITNVLPIGHIGIDLWRLRKIYQITGISYLNIIKSILSDRISGLVGLAFVSLLATIVILSFFPNIAQVFNSYTFFNIGLFSIIFLLAIFACIFVFIIKIIIKLIRSFISNETFLKIIFYFEESLQQSMYIKVFILSLFNNILIMISFYLCSSAVGLEISLLTIFCLSLFIIIPSLLPFSILGFGPREAGVISIFYFYGIGIEESFISSLLFGLTLTIQGLIGSIFFIISKGKI